jgi:uncharacterized membrane protein YuzA (DUF378 family)
MAKGASNLMREQSLSALTKTLIVIAIIGALNWGLVGLFNWNLVDAIFGGGAREETSGISRVIYALVGLGGLVALFLLPKVRTPHAQVRTQTPSTAR